MFEFEKQQLFFTKYKYIALASYKKKAKIGKIVYCDALPPDTHKNTLAVLHIWRQPGGSCKQL